ncbi:hypothetical protein E2C01_061576 [Portunus trituberculatus]|uniref:Uncharacterized protein n=1 Tax=Portunus trituberculatus TaxID=210409 RepID=A0A5B7H477_PORTR|nr:hypothetical protein [Portunus trituberculatus]
MTGFGLHCVYCSLICNVPVAQGRARRDITWAVIRLSQDSWRGRCPYSHHHIPSLVYTRRDVTGRATSCGHGGWRTASLPVPGEGGYPRATPFLGGHLWGSGYARVRVGQLLLAEVSGCFRTNERRRHGGDRTGGGRPWLRPSRPPQTVPGGGRGCGRCPGQE